MRLADDLASHAARLRHGKDADSGAIDRFRRITEAYEYLSAHLKDNAHGNGHTDVHFDSNSNCDGDIYSYTNGNSETDALAQTMAYTEASSDSGASPVVHIGAQRTAPYEGACICASLRARRLIGS